MQNSWRPLTRALTEAMQAHVPGWSDRSDADPGVTILELIAYLADGMRRYEQPTAGRAAAAVRAIESLEAFSRDEQAPSSVNTAVTEAWSGTTRLNFFSGRLLTADDLRAEQQFHIDKHRRHLRFLHGRGVVAGLGVTVSHDGRSVTVEPGVALDASGNEIVLDEATVMTPGVSTASSTWIVLEYAERGINAVPTADAEPQASRIEEGCRITAATSPSDSGVTIARLVNAAGVWRVDPAFVPPRTR